MLAVFLATASDRKRGAAPERFRKYRQTQLVYRALLKSVKRVVSYFDFVANLVTRKTATVITPRPNKKCFRLMK
jgi:hypothetical protein